ncbi:DUF1735 and LamG domain-containing protein [Bacteroides fragilis]|nr:DUF1735 and LamG domain-containing protein [Bacteroides fragilis]UVS01774.1 DUF1735 and LamG domain-containing protein [Bacteroides fragilis]
MKRVTIKSYLLACVVLPMILAGCEDADYRVIDNAIYLNEASENGSAKVTVDPENVTTTTLTVRMGRPVAGDVTAVLMIDPSILKEYNEANETSYEVLPEQYFSYDKEIKIQAGDVSAVPSEFKVKPYSNENGELYAIPVSLTEIQGPVSTIGLSSKFIILLDKPLIQSVPFMNTTNAVKPSKEGLWGVTTNEWSLEAWVQMDGFDINNQAIFNSGSKDHEVYIRFGDAMIPYNSLQVKTLGSQVNTVTLFEKDKWYHLAFVYNSSGLLSIYINGVLDVTLQTKGGPVRFDTMNMVSSGSYFRNNCQMAQVRLWKTAISQTQIQSNMYFAVKPADPNLIGYWKMDEGKGNAFADCTGHGYDLTAGGTLVWKEHVRFDKQ